MDGLFSSDWKSRETTLTLISREVIAHLLPHVPPKGGGGEGAAKGSEVRGEGRGVVAAVDTVQSLCLEVVGQCCGDSVLKVFLASMVRTSPSLAL